MGIESRKCSECGTIGYLMYCPKCGSSYGMDNERDGNRMGIWAELKAKTEIMKELDKKGVVYYDEYFKLNFEMSKDMFYAMCDEMGLERIYTTKEGDE